MSELEVKDAIIREMVKSLKRLGAKSDLLGVVCSYGETYTDEQVLEELREWAEAVSATATHPDPTGLPRCPTLDGSNLLIVPGYVEAGAYTEANCVTITDGERTAVYVPANLLPARKP